MHEPPTDYVHVSELNLKPSTVVHVQGSLP